MLQLLDLFTLETPVWTAEALVRKLGMGQATIYRYIGDLQDAGFLAAAAGGGYVLGPRFIVFDREIRLADPLLQVAPQIMRDVGQRVGGTQLLCSFYGTTVVTIHQEGQQPSHGVSLERGRQWPLFRGSPSRILLAHMPVSSLRALFIEHADEIRAAGLGDSWPSFHDHLKALRRAGYSIAKDEINVGSAGASSPIFREPGVITGCLCLFVPSKDLRPEELDTLAETAVEAGKRITERLQQFGARNQAFPSARL
ncbi:MAG: hypothetical protein ABS99_05780 [Acetobacteraceae bacterium SCN 69-10]|nr:MAG: hypothetical protein ABS99_05780 [Acetobacteraceae bacterium SCN 69-10]